MKKQTLPVGYTLGLLLGVALVFMLLASCTAQRGGCQMAKGYSGYGSK